MKEIKYILLVLIAAYAVSTFACDMTAIIVKQNSEFSFLNNLSNETDQCQYNTPLDYLAFIMSKSSAYQHNDGYGIVYYPKKVRLLNETHWWYKHVRNYFEANNVYYTGNLFDINNPDDVFDKAFSAINTPGANTGIVLCHARNASTNPFAPGNHPFRMELNGVTYSFMHNGSVSTATRTLMINEINLQDGTWFDIHKPNLVGFDNSDNPAYWIDSEVLFNYLMFNIVDNGYNVLNGLRSGLVKLKEQMELSTNIVNFVFTDGLHIYAFRSTPLTGVNSSYKLCFNSNQTNFYAVRTGAPTSVETEIRKYEMVVLSANIPITLYPNFLSDVPYDNNRPPTELSMISLYKPVSINQSGSFGMSISFNLPNASRIKVNLYNSKGQLIRRVTDSFFYKGTNSIRWDGRDMTGRIAGNGIYLVEIFNNNRRTINKVTYLR